MKRVALLITILALFSIASVSAIETTLKQEYQTGETLIAEFSGITEVKTDNILFYSGRAYTPLVYDLAKIQDKYYLYALLPFEEKNLTLKLIQTKFFEQGKEVSRDLEFNFLVKGNISAFSVNPGFIITNEDFKIKIQNYDKPFAITSKFLGKTETYNLAIGEEKTLNFQAGKNTTLEILTLESSGTKYTIPVSIFSNETIKKGVKSMRFSKSFLNITVLKDSPIQYELYLMNNGQEDIENIQLDSSEIINLSPAKLAILKSGEIEIINITITSEESKNTTITATSSNITTEIFLFIQAIEDKQEFQEIISNQSQSSGILTRETCSSLNGRICNANEVCSVPEKITIDGYCCPGYCQAKSSSFSWIYILVIIIVLALIAFFVYRKLKLKRQTSKEIFKLKEKEFEDRFKPQEAKGSLTRI